MVTKEWFDLVLPTQGRRVIAVLPDGHEGFRHKYTTDNATAAWEVARLDQPGFNIFYALGGFTDNVLDKTRDAKGKLTIGGRKQANVGWLRAFWADLDCGEGKGYATRRDALQALAAFRHLTHLPTPSVVSSGNGLHIYWHMEEDIERDAWKPVAVQLKQAFKIAGVLADPTRTADEASVLRPVGAHHRKRGAVEVTLLKQGTPCSFEFFAERIAAFLEANNVAPEPVRSGGKKSSINSDLTGGMEYPPSDANRVADRCAVIGLLRETQGNVSQPTWYHGLSIVSKCADGADWAHEWSCGHPKYSPEETAAKLEQLEQYGPATCATLAQHQPDLCAACPHNGTLTSPIFLGAIQAAPVEDEEPATSAQTSQGALPRKKWEPPNLPPGYVYKPIQGTWSLARLVVNEEGDKVPEPFCDTLIYPIKRVADDEAAMELRFHVRTNDDGSPAVEDTMTLRSALIGCGGAELSKALAARELAPNHPAQATVMHAYLNAWMRTLRSTHEKTESKQHFGWHGDDFLVGTTLFDGKRERHALLKNGAKQCEQDIGVKGDFDVWKRVIHRAYHHPGQEHFQFTVALAFASPLFSLFDEFGGIVVHAYSQGSGYGKTTAQRAALSAWGNWRKMQLADGKVTENMLYAKLGTYHNIPIMYDELTNQKNDAATNVVFSVSSGTAKQRMAADGSFRTNSPNWSTILMSSGNNQLSEKLQQTRAHSEAEMVRAWEFRVPEGSAVSVTEAGTLFSLLLDNYGHAGIKFAAYIAGRRAKLQATLNAVRERIVVEAGIQQSERYWAALMASVVTAVSICNKLGILEFSLHDVKAWMYQELENNRRQRDSAASNPMELFGRMMADLWPGVLTTVGDVPDLRKKQAVYPYIPSEVVAPRTSLVGRVVLPYHEEKRRTTLWLSAAAVREWCNKKGISAREMHSALVKAGRAHAKVQLYGLGRGLTQYAAAASPVPCWVIDADETHSTQLTVIPGGKEDVTNGRATSDH